MTYKYSSLLFTLLLCVVLVVSCIGETVDTPTTTQPTTDSIIQPTTTQQTTTQPTTEPPIQPTTETPKTEFTREEVAAIEEIADDAGKVVPLAEEKDEIIDSTTEDKGDFRYTYEKHDVVDNIDSVVYLGLNDDVIWPGSLVEGAHAHDFVYVPISVERAPVTLSISLEGSPATGGSLVQTVEDPKLSNIRQGISDLLKDAITEDTHVPARVDFNYKQVYNESQMNLFVGADVSYGAGSLDTRFN